MPALRVSSTPSAANLGLVRALRVCCRSAAILAAALAWPADSKAPSDEQLPGGGAACFAGDVGCRNDAFTLAAALLAADNVRHVVIGRIVHVEGLPETLGERRVVEASLSVRNVRKPPGSCWYPVRNSIRDDDCEEAPMPRLLMLRIPSDWFLWPATGTSRRVARRAGRHLLGLPNLERDLVAGRISERDHEAGRARLVREALAAADAEHRVPGVAVRLLEDRALHLEVGVEYLFALGAERRGADGPYHLPETPDVDADAQWHFFAGSELDDVDIALRGIGNCLTEDGVIERPTIDDCMIVARGAATYTSAHPRMRRH